jgi:hypothetical protein
MAMGRSRFDDAHAGRSSRGMIADRRTATRSHRPARRHAAFNAHLLFGLKLVASTLAGALVTMAVWNVAAKPTSVPNPQPARHQAADGGQASTIVRGVPAQPAEGADASVETERPAPSNFPKPVKTVRFTPPAD